MSRGEASDGQGHDHRAILYRRLVVGGGRAPGFPPGTPGDLSLNISPAAIPDVLGSFALLPFRDGVFSSLYFERIPFMAFTGRYADALVEAARILQPSGRLTIETGVLAPERTSVDTLRAAGFAAIVVECAGLLRISARRRGT
jgi:hypothetical protein